MKNDPITVTDRRSSPQHIDRTIDPGVASFWHEVDQLASEQISDISIPLLVSILFPVRHDTALDRIGFEARLRRGIAIYALIQRIDIAVLNLLYRPESIDRLMPALPVGKPVVFLGEHITSGRVLTFLATHLSTNSVRLDRPDVQSQGGATSLVRLIRALQSGKHVIISPDGAIGGSIAQINILGFSTRIGKGAAVLAHTAKCPVVAIHAVVEENQFVPKLVFGPSPSVGEGLGPFVARVMSFYEDHLNVLVKSDPINIGNPKRILMAFRQSVRTMGPLMLKNSIEACEEALRYGDDTYITYHILTGLYRRAGDRERAIRHTKRAISVAKSERDKIAQTISLAGLLRLEKRLDEACDLVNLRIAEFPDSARLHLAKSQVLASLRKYQEAIEAAESALTLDPVNPVICHHLAVLYTRTGDMEKAADYGKRAGLAQAGNHGRAGGQS